MTKFQRIKRALITRATDIYTDMRHDIPVEEYPHHFKTMGELIAQIDSHEDLAEIINAVCKGSYDILGLEPSCDESIEEFFQEIFSK